MSVTDNPNSDTRNPPVDVHRPGRGGDRGGRRPRLLADKPGPQTRKFPYPWGPEEDWVKRTAGWMRVAPFVRLILTAAAGLGFGWELWEAIVRDPARYRAALQKELDRETKE